MLLKRFLSIGLGFLIICLLSPGLRAQAARRDGSSYQRLEIMLKNVETMRKSLKTAASSIKEKDEDKNNLDSPRNRLKSLEKEMSGLYTEVSTLKGKVERSEKFDSADIDKLDVVVSEIQNRYDTTLKETAPARSSTASAPIDPNKKERKKGVTNLFGLFGGKENEYEELVGTVAPGRDRVLFAMATKEIRKSRYEVGRLLYQTIVTTYPDSLFLPMAKLAIADSFYLEGETSSLIQAAAAYQDWLTFFPTHYLSDRVLLKVAESQMRRMLIPGRDPSAARVAEQRLKAHLQQYPKSELRSVVQKRLEEVQENLGDYTRQIADFYYDKAINQDKQGLKGAQNRYREILDRFPNYSRNDIVLYRIGVTYMREEENDEAAKYFQRIVRRFPWSEYKEKATEQLKVIGAEVPETDPDAANSQAPEGRGIFTTIKQEALGITNIRVEKDGVLVSKDFDKDKKELIDIVLENEGELPDQSIPRAPTTNRPVSQNPTNRKPNQ